MTYDQEGEMRDKFVREYSPSEEETTEEDDNNI